MSNVKLVVKNKGPIHSSSAYVFFDDLNDAVINSITPSKGEYRDGMLTSNERNDGEDYGLSFNPYHRITENMWVSNSNHLIDRFTPSLGIVAGFKTYGGRLG